MPELVKDLLLIFIVIILFDIRSKLKTIEHISCRIWDVIPKRVGDENPD
jgi:hypothetical protein